MRLVGGQKPSLKPSRFQGVQQSVPLRVVLVVADAAVDGVERSRTAARSQ
jgi:hypothetical protein